MGPGMSARNIALLRSHWTSTILPISVSQTQRSAGLLLGAAHGVFGSCHVRPLQTDSFQIFRPTSFLNVINGLQSLIIV